MKTRIMTNSRSNPLHILLWFTLLGVLAPLSTGAETGTDRTSSPVSSPVSGLAPGDAIELRFWQEPALSGEFPIDERGIVVLPLMGEYQATGVTPVRLRRQLLERYSRELTNQEVRVTPLRRIPILGSVKNPGLYRIDSTIKVSDALALAGGQTVDGKNDQVFLLRNARKISIPLDRMHTGPALFRSGDQIFVPQRNWFARNSLFLVTGAISATAIIYAASL